MTKSNDGPRDDAGEAPTGPAQATGKKTYKTPTLVSYGSVSKLTQSGGMSRVDGPVGFMMN